MTQEEFAIQMRGGIYVHNHPTRSYARVKKTIIDRYKYENFSNFIIKKVTKQSTIGVKEKDEFFKFYGGAKSEGYLQRYIQNAISQVNIRTASERAGQYDNLYQAIDKIKTQDIEAIKEVNLWLKEVLASFKGRGLYSIAEDIVLRDIVRSTADIFTNSLESSNNWYADIKRDVLSKLSDKGGAITMSTKSEEFNRQKNIILLIYLFSKHLDSKLQSDGDITAKEADVLSKYAKYMVNRLTSVIGFAYQPIVTNLIKEGTDKTINELIEEVKEVGADGNIRLSYSKSDGNAGGTTTVGTQDIKIIFKDNIEQLKTEVGITINLPDIGASLKYAGGLRAGKTSIIKIKDKGTNLGTLLHDIDNKHLSYIYNIIANYKRTNIRVQNKRIANPITYQDYQDMWSNLKVILLVSGLIGQMTDQDLSYYFIVSGKVYTVIDIIRSIVEGASLKWDNQTQVRFGIEMSNVPKLVDPSQTTIAKNHVFETRLSTPWANAKLRSDTVVSNIQSAKLQAGIRMRVTKL